MSVGRGRVPFAAVGRRLVVGLPAEIRDVVGGRRGAVTVDG